eukprot:9337481-Pyramimonas_sp.AAC.1
MRRGLGVGRSSRRYPGRACGPQGRGLETGPKGGSIARTLRVREAETRWRWRTCVRLPRSGCSA